MPLSALPRLVILLLIAGAAEMGRRFDDRVRTFYNRKAARKNRMIAHSTLAHKMARAAFFIMRENVTFNHDRLFA